MKIELEPKDKEWLEYHTCLENLLLCSLCNGPIESATEDCKEYPLHSEGRGRCLTKDCPNHIANPTSTKNWHQVSTQNLLYSPFKANPRYQQILDKYMPTTSTPSDTSDKASIYKDLASVTTELSSIHTSLSTLLPRQKELEDKFQVLLKQLNPTRDLSNDDPLL